MKTIKNTAVRYALKTLTLKQILVFVAFFSLLNLNAQTLQSPDGKLKVVVDIPKASYQVYYDNKEVLEASALGLIRSDEDFSKSLILKKVGKTKTVKDQYQMLTAKKSDISYSANETTIFTTSASGKKMNIIFRLSNDGLAFRYVFPGKSKEVLKINKESTTFNFPGNAKAWLQPKTESQTGFEHTNPSYEAHYELDIPVDKSSPGPNGWVFPALYQSNGVWVMITEADLGYAYCGTALQQHSPKGEYSINFPQAPEVFKDGKATLNPESTLPWKTPWRILAVGDLKTLMESTLGTDLAQPAVKMKKDFIKPGKASWSWIIEKDNSIVYKDQIRYIDFASEMQWQYCLVDANWDNTIGYDSINILSRYAQSKNVSLLLWYNSAGSWNTVTMTPKGKLLTHADRMQEFAKISAMGVKGIKVDFFAGDGQSMMIYYRDILEDAAKFGLLVNFHGATLPRGLHRTYPNFMTAEAIFGYEMITFGQGSANKEPEHAVMSAMVRNAYDPMDFTPMNLYKIPRINRKTTAAFELATAVVYLSGIQHFAETPQGMEKAPESVKAFLRSIPDYWQDVRYIDGFPGKHYVVARKSGDKWYVAGINGEGVDKELTLDLSFLKGSGGQMYKNGNNAAAEVNIGTEEVMIPQDGKLKVKLVANDGFVLVVGGK